MGLEPGFESRRYPHETLLTPGSAFGSREPENSRLFTRHAQSLNRNEVEYVVARPHSNILLLYRFSPSVNSENSKLLHALPYF